MTDRTRGSEPRPRAFPGIDPDGAVIAALRDRGGAGETIAVIRHSARLPITEATLEAAFTTPLTEEGRTRAVSMGAALPRPLPVRLWHSPAPRCEETAACLARGLESQGGTAVREGEWSLLGGEFIRDASAVVTAFAEQGPRGFFRAWSRGELGTSVVMDLPRAADNLLRAILQAGTGSGQPALRLHVTHDIVIVALLASVCDVTDPAIPWPGYLEGVVLDRVDGRVRCAYGDRDHLVDGF